MRRTAIHERPDRIERGEVLSYLYLNEDDDGNLSESGYFRAFDDNLDSAAHNIELLTASNCAEPRVIFRTVSRS